MRKIRQILRLAHEDSISRRSIARSLGLSRDAVTDTLIRAAAAGLTWPLPDGLDDAQLEARLFPSTAAMMRRKVEPDWAAIHNELKRKGATLQVLHEEYLTRQPDGMSYSHFCKGYRTWAKTLKRYLRQPHTAGERVFVDYAGPTMRIIDRASGEIRHAQIFVGVLGASNYTYAEAHWSQQLPDWIAAHVRMLEFFGGVPQCIVCDNLKAAVTRASRTEPLVNDSYQNFASHYGTIIVPARAYRPKDKAKVEGHVLIVERWILFRLRKHVFTSLGELNAAIRELLLDLNTRPFQKLPGNRVRAFETVDRPALRALPTAPYEYIEFRRGRVGMDRMVDVGGRLFSAPPRLVNALVDIRVTAGVVELLHGGRRVASHARTTGAAPVVDPAHVPAADHAYANWSPQRELDWAATIGPRTSDFVVARLVDVGNKTVGYRLGLRLRKLAGEFGATRLESACVRALAIGAASTSSLHAILTNRLDLAAPDVIEADFSHENVRGPEHYH
jgi:transposase